MRRIVFICLAGGLGSGARYLVGGWMLAALGPKLPWGTLTVNLVGSFLLGVVAVSTWPASVKLTLGTGFLGGFTTYSSFNQESVAYMKSGAHGTAWLYVVLMVSACLAAGFLGGWMARRYFFA